MGEDDILELIWKRDQLVSSSHTQRPTSDPHILRGSGSGGGEGENAPIPPPPPQHHQNNIFIQEDELAARLHHCHREDDFYSDLLYSGIVAASQPQNSISLAPPPPRSQTIAVTRAENFTNFERLRGNLITGAGQVGSRVPPSTVIGGVSHTFAVPGLSRKAKEVSAVCEVAGTSSSGVFKAETGTIQIQPPTETEIADDRKRKEREETESGRLSGSTSTSTTTTTRKSSRAAEMHNLSERRRRERINERMRTLQELIPRCNKSDRASMLDDVIEYVKSLQMQLQMMSVGGGGMPMMYAPNMQRFMPQMPMGMNRPPFIPPFPSQAHMAGLGPSYPATRYPFQPNPVWNQPQFPGYMNPYSQFVGLEQMQQPPPLQNQATSQVNVSQATGSKEPEDQENQPTG